MNKWLTTKETAKELGLSSATVVRNYLQDQDEFCDCGNYKLEHQEVCLECL